MSSEFAADAMLFEADAKSKQQARSSKADQDQMIEIRISHFEAEGSVPPLHYTR